MKSSSGQYYVALDHIRAVAAFMVFSWHFIHASGGPQIPFEYVPAVFPCSLLNEGHTGVALFMTLSGYLFAKLLDGRRINYPAFIWNRFLRLFPLLALVIVIVGFTEYRMGNPLLGYTKKILMGALLPTLPNGGWSITAEFHFYLVLPLLLWMSRKSKFSLFGVGLGVLGLRILLHRQLGEIQTLSFWTIIGRVDQFLFGILAYQFRNHVTGRHLLVLGWLSAFSLFYWYFDLQGGFYKNPSYPSPGVLWIFLPAIEGMAYAMAIVWYDTSFSHSDHAVSQFIARMGAYSYSIYLLHFFIVFDLARAIHGRLIPLSNFYLALVFSAAAFLLMMPIGYLSYRFVESPFLKLRRQYIKTDRQPLPEHAMPPRSTA